MTTYGTIPTSSSSLSPPNTEYMVRARERLLAGLGTRRSWDEMFNFQSIALPANLNEAIGRIRTNLSYFRMNYIVVVILIVFLSLLMHPFTLIFLVVTMAAWLFLYFLRDAPLVISGRLIEDSVVLGVLSVATIFFLLFTDVTANTLMSLSVGTAVVLVHGAARKTEDLFLDQETGSGGKAVLFAGAGSGSA